MQSTIKILLFACGLTALTGCKENKDSDPDTKTPKKKKESAKVIFIQPFTDIPAQPVNYILEKIKTYWPDTKLLSPVDLPASAYYKPRNRYRADSLIDWLRRRVSNNQYILGLTSKDISTTKPPNPDSGIFGLGFLDGPACVASSFRLKRNTNEQLFKTVIHELGHNFGLEHCPEKTCYMRDAEGKNPLDEEIEFCPDCRNTLSALGWKF